MHDTAPIDWFQLLHEGLMREHFHNPDTEATRATYSAIAAHDLPNGPAVWMMNVAPAGSAKTSALDPLEVLPNVHAIDKLTPNTFLSGQIATTHGQRSSLLHRIGPNGIITMPDFSTILGMRPDDKASILADLRRIFDGHLRKEVGTSDGSLEWRGRLTVVVAVTPEIDRHYGVFGSLGERFVMTRWSRAGGEDHGEDAALVAMNQDPERLRADLAESVSILFDDLPHTDVMVSQDIRAQIAALAEFVVRARTHVPRDSTHSKNLIYLPEAEAPTRLAQQLCQLARGSARLSRRPAVNDEDIRLARRVGFDCVPRLRWRVLEAARTGRGHLTTEIPRATLHYVREDLRLVELLTKSGQLSARARQLLARASVHQKSPTNENGKRN